MLTASVSFASAHLMIGAKNEIEYAELLCGRSRGKISPSEAVAVVVRLNTVRGPVKTRLLSFRFCVVPRRVGGE